MKKKIILGLKVFWATAALTLLFVGTNLCGSSAEACVAASGPMALSMVIFAFPTGIIFFPIAMAFVDQFGGQPLPDLLFAWSVLAIGGYLQWFYIMPRLLEKPRFTLLNLNAEPTASEVQPQVPVRALAIATSIPAAQISAPPVRIRARKRQNQIRSFDKLGRSPLERALNR